MILENMYVCDLRFAEDIYSVEEIKKIRNVGLLILPEHTDSRIEKILDNVKRENVAAEIYAEDDDNMLICILKGCCEFKKKFWKFSNINGTKF